MNQLMKDLRLPVAALATTVGMNAGGVDAAKVEETFGDKLQTDAQISLVTGEDARDLGGNLAGKVGGVQVVQFRGNTKLLTDIQEMARRLNGSTVYPGKSAVPLDLVCPDNIQNTVSFKGESGLELTGWISSGPYPGQLGFEVIAHDGCEQKGTLSIPFNADKGTVSMAGVRSGTFSALTAAQVAQAINNGFSQ